MKILCLILSAFYLSACSSSSKDCTPGERRTCICPNASQSLQNCNESGKWDECECNGQPDGGGDGETSGDDGGLPDAGDEPAGDPGQTTDDLPPAYTIESLCTDPPAEGTPVGLVGVVVTSEIFDDYDHEDYSNPMKSFFVSAPELFTSQANSGMLVALATGVTPPALTSGDVVNLSGRVYSSDDPPAFGMSMVKVGTDDRLEKTGTAVPPVPAFASAAQAASEEWEAVRVAVDAGAVTAVNNAYNTVTIDDVLEIDDHIIRSLNGGDLVPFEACVNQTVDLLTGFNYYSYSTRRLLPSRIDDVRLTGSCDQTVDCGDAPTADHLLLSEVVVTPSENEFVEIHNPTQAAIDLSNYHLWNATYRNVTADCCEAPGASAVFHWSICTAAGRTALETGWDVGYSDFLIRFPSGSSIGAGEYQTVALHGREDFCQAYGQAPDYELAIATGGDCMVGGQAVAVPAMQESPLGFSSAGDAPRLSNGGEDVVLFSWSGTDGDPVQDADFVVWGDKCEVFDRAGSESCNASSYQADSACSLQQVVAEGQHSSVTSFQRACVNEGSEAKAGGNGLTGNDETSENLPDTWLEAEPTPGAAAP